MSQSEGSYGRITHQVLSCMRTHAGERFTAGDVARQIGRTPTQARMALDTLVRDGVIDREQLANGADRYVYRPQEPSCQG